MDQSKQYSVIIIGGGLSGLSSADYILNHNPKAKVVVLEAMDRVGGRTYSVEYNGAYFDLGAQWIGGDQKYIKKLAQRADNKLSQQNTQGVNIMDFYKKIQTYEKQPSHLGEQGLAQLNLIKKKLDKFAKSVPLDDPKRCQNAMQWDSMTFSSWIHQNIKVQKLKLYLQVICRIIFSCQANQLSFLFFLWYVHHNGGIQYNIDAGLEDFRMTKGSQYLSIYLKQEIQKRKGVVLLGEYVNLIQNLHQKCIVRTESGKKFEADYAIIAMPPCNVKKIRFFPDLSPARKMIHNKNILGQCTKLVLLYDEPYWRKKGFSGFVATNCLQSPMFESYDCCKPKLNGQMQYGIVVFINAAFVRQWLNKPQWEQKAIEYLAKAFNQQKMLKPVKTFWKNWQEQPSVQGSYVAYFPPGVLTQIKDLRMPQGRIHWGGTELALKYQGYMQGAIESGYRAGQQVLDRFQDHNKLPLKTQFKKQKEGFWYNRNMMGSL